MALNKYNQVELKVDDIKNKHLFASEATGEAATSHSQYALSRLILSFMQTKQV